MGQALGSDSTPLQLLLIEDDEEVRRSFQLLLQGHGLRSVPSPARDPRWPETTARST